MITANKLQGRETLSTLDLNRLNLIQILFSKCIGLPCPKIIHSLHFCQTKTQLQCQSQNLFKSSAVDKWEKLAKLLADGEVCQSCQKLAKLTKVLITGKICPRPNAGKAVKAVLDLKVYIFHILWP